MTTHDRVHALWWERICTLDSGEVDVETTTWILTMSEYLRALDPIAVLKEGTDRWNERE